MKTEPNMRSYIAADVRFTPESGHVQRNKPMSALCQ